MLKIIVNNPYRFLGVYSNSPLKDRVANTGRLKAYLKVGKDVVFPLDLTNLMPAVSRTMEGMNVASNSLNIPNDQLKYALFWFVNGTSIDKMALEHLQNGNTTKAIELFGKKEVYSSLINRGVMAFIQGNEGEAIQYVTQVIHNTQYRDAFVNAVCGTTFKISEDDLAQLFIDTLIDEIPVTKLKNLFEKFGTSSSDNSVLQQKVVGQHIAAINAAIAEAKNVNSDNAFGQLQAGTKLMNTTKSDLQAVRSILGIKDMKCQMLVDNLAKQILQCGINYYNNTSEDDDVSIDKAMVLQNYALSIAVGKMMKDRCKENVDILQKKKADLPPSAVKDEVKAILTELANYCKKPDLICHAVTLLNNTKTQLQSMKNKLGVGNAYYLKISTMVVSNALHNVIEEVNNVQNDPSLQIKMQLGLSITSSDLNQLQTTLREAWKATTIMDGFDTESEFRSRYNTNRNTLKGICSQLGVSTYTSTNSTTSTTNSKPASTAPRIRHKPTSTTPIGTSTSNRSSSYSSSSGSPYSNSSGSSSSNDDTPWGCIIAIIIFIVICLAQCN